MKKKLFIAGAALVVVLLIVAARVPKPQNWRALSWGQKLNWLWLRLKASGVDGAKFE